MASAMQSVHERLVREAADSYTRQGYYVRTSPSEKEMPDFLKGFKPDMIVRLPDGDHIVVQVKSSGAMRDSEQWQQLKNAVEANPGWRLELVLNNRREQELITASQPLLSLEEVEARVLAGRQLAEQGLLDGSLLITWSALEALLRRICQQKKVKLPDQAPATLVTMLVSEGFLNRENYQPLMQILPVRNQAAHGHQPELLNRALVEQLHAITSRLLEQQRKRRRAVQKNGATQAAPL